MPYGLRLFLPLLLVVVALLALSSYVVHLSGVSGFVPARISIASQMISSRIRDLSATQLFGGSLAMENGTKRWDMDPVRPLPESTARGDEPQQVAKLQPEQILAYEKIVDSAPPQVTKLQQLPVIEQQYLRQLGFPDDVLYIYLVRRATHYSRPRIVRYTKFNRYPTIRTMRRNELVVGTRVNPHIGMWLNLNTDTMGPIEP